MHVLRFVGRGMMEFSINQHQSLICDIFFGFSESMVKYYMGANFLNL